MKITKAILKKYLNNPDDCPFCDNEGGEGLHAHNNDITSNTSCLWRNVICKDCGREWTEEFELTLIDNLIDNLIEPES